MFARIYDYYYHYYYYYKTDAADGNDDCDANAKTTTKAKESKHQRRRTGYGPTPMTGCKSKQQGCPLFQRVSPPISEDWLVCCPWASWQFACGSLGSAVENRDDWTQDRSWWILVAGSQDFHASK